MHHLFSHNDLDGIGCGIVAKFAFGDKIEVRYNSLEGFNTQVERFLQRREKGKKDGHLFMTDMSVNESNEHAIAEYIAAGGKARLIDHHKSAAHLNKHPWAQVQVDYEDGRLASATSLFYDYLLQHRLIKPTPPLAEFVELVRQYDTWEWDANDNVQAKRLNDLFFLLSIDDFEEKMLERVRSQHPFSFNEFEQKILDMEEEKIGRYLRKKRRELVQAFIDDRCAGIVHAESYHSELGNELGKEYPHLDYIAIMNMGNKRVSFRTIHDEIDVSAIAEKHGGGGHAKAAGCSMTDAVYRSYIAEPFHTEPVRADANRNEFNVKGSDYGTLYENAEARFFLYPRKGEWYIDQNWEKLEASFPSFEEAERYVKRNHSAYLVRDEHYIRFLMEYQQAQAQAPPS